MGDFECIAFECVTIPLGAFETIKVKVRLTDMEKTITRVAYVWYSHELKSLIKMSLEESPPWSSEQQNYELTSFNFKGKQLTPIEAIKPIPQKLETPPKALPSSIGKPQAPMSTAQPPITPQTSINRVEVPSKNSPSQPEKPQTITPAALPSLTSPPTINKVVVTGTHANIRSGAGNEFPILITVKQGDKLILLGEYGDWYAVKLENGQEGWINNRFAK